MKKYSLLNVLALIIFFFISSCKKDVSVGNSIYINPPPGAGIFLKTNAGPDDVIYLPTNYSTLSGRVSYNGTGAFSVVWKKISGPTSFLIEKPDSLLTRISDLVNGT